MRESNFNSPAQNRACVCITSALYDRRAIDAPSPSLPLVNSLTHLSYLTATSPRIREILSLDGGLERLVRILKRCASSASASAAAAAATASSSSAALPASIASPPSEPTLLDLKGRSKDLGKGPRRSPFRSFAAYGVPTVDGGVQLPSPSPTSSYGKHLMYTYTLAFQCIVNIGVRGSEMIRTRVVEAGALDVVVHVLEKYLEKVCKDKKRSAGAAAATGEEDVRRSEKGRFEEVDEVHVERDARRRGSTPESMDEVETEAEGDEKRAAARSAKANDHDGDGDIVMDVDPSSTAPASSSASSPSSQNNDAAVRTAHAGDLPEGLQFRDEDVLLSLQLLAYLSKYPHVRSVFHSPSDFSAYDDVDMDCHDDDDDDDDLSPSSSLKPSPPSSSTTTPTLSSNVFSLVEAFTHRPANNDRLAPRHSHEVQYWAGVIMRNACRKDENQGGIRQCANMQCGVWEKQAREFAKCRRCRKAKYCSKGCQSKAWQLGHRYWCAKATPKEPPHHVGHSDVAASSVEDVRIGGAAADDASEVASSSSGASTPSSSRRTTGRSSDSSSRRHHHHHHHHHHRADASSAAAAGAGVGAPGAPRALSAIESNDDDDDAQEENLPPPAGRRHSVHPHPHPHHRHSFDAVVVGDMAGVGLDENEVAQEMMGGGVFGERVNARPGVE